MDVTMAGTAPTTVRLSSLPNAKPLDVSLFRHTVTGVEWLASGQAVPDGDDASLSVFLDPALIAADVCVEIRVQHSGGESVELTGNFFSLEPNGWTLTPERPEQLRQARADFFAKPVVASSAAATAPSFQAIALIEGLLLTENSRVPGIEIYALNSPLGTADAAVDYLSRLSDELFGLAFAAHAGSPQTGLPCVGLKFADVRAASPDDAVAAVLDISRRMTDLLGFNRHARPDVIGAAVLDAANAGVRYWLDPARTQYTGNLVGGFIAGESTHDLLTQWGRMDVDPRLALWLSQINDARAERRWEYRVLRYFNLLEGVAKGSLGTKVAVVDSQGQPRLQDSGRAYTTKEARGAVYMVIAGLCRQRGDISEDSFYTFAPLWELCQHWTTVRNQVAHAGAWESPYKVGGIDKVAAYLSASPEARRADLESVLRDCVRFVVDGVIFRGYLPL